jgi:GTPase SAR1 family protein
MNQLEGVIDNYLNKETDYALLVTGDWGSGKTYYFKEVLFNIIKEKPTISDASKLYKPLLISLYGLKSISEIQTEIFLSLHSILQNKYAKTGINLLKVVAKGMSQFQGFGNAFDKSNQQIIDHNDWIDFNNLVICFDDIERKSESLKLEEFIGYVNTLVENENIKVILIANGEKLDDFNNIKEKTIGITIEFQPNFDVSIESLIDRRFSGFTAYQNFLMNNKEIFPDLFLKHSKNLRTIAYALSHFQVIHSLLENNLQTNNNFRAEKKEIIKSLFKFCLSISIEYREGKITYTKREGLGKERSFNLSQYNLDVHNRILKRDKKD